MITDKFVYFAEGVATGNTGTRILGDVIDLQQVRDIGAGQPIYLVVQVKTAITAASGGTYAVKLTSGTNDALANPQDHVVSATFSSAATIAAGTELLKVALPMEGPAYKRYIGVQEVVASQNTTAGAVSAFLVFDAVSYKAYPNAVS
jgi:hypothetical protein